MKSPISEKQKMSNGRKTRNKKIDAGKLHLDKFATKMRIPGNARTDALFRLKTGSTIERLIHTFTHGVRKRQYLDSFHGLPFPPTIGEMFQIPAYVRPGTAAAELTWGLLRASRYAVELSGFVAMRESFEAAVLLDNRAESIRILDEIERQFGWSLWLIQNRLTMAQVLDGLEQKRELAIKYLDEAADKQLTRALINFIGRRSEATGLKNYLQEELAKFLGNTKSPVLEAYIRTKLFELGNFGVENIGATLLFEAQSSLIDHYETLVIILQSVTVDLNAPAEFFDSTAKVLLANCAAIDDRRLRAVARTMSGSPKFDEAAFPLERTQLVEAYSVGNYLEVALESTSYLLNNPSDVSICALRAKAVIALEVETDSLPGMLGEVERLFKRLLVFGAETYGAAYGLYTLQQRFYGHSWSILACAIMGDALAKESLDYPRPTYKYILSLDFFVTPFTILSLRPLAKSKLSENLLIRDRYPHTFSVLSALTNGSEPLVDIPHRIAKFRARYLLNQKDFAGAADQYSELMKVGTISDRSRAAACATLAYLQLDDLERAVQALTYGAIINKEVSIILPILETVDRFNNPRDWPDNIALPLAFELYHRYIAEDKVAHLRLAFERFQLAHEVSEPEDLLEREPACDRAHIIEYLDKVWRPETMRQTLLYETPKQIEDARISVCRTLASIDSAGASRYQDEIRDRVKRQEIAKGTTLVEQSKVYVDIYAIKKTLNAKLGDTYTRYKNAIRAAPGENDEIVERIADIISEKSGSDASLSYNLSKLHILDYKASELDLQFTALFSEVTNEFLRGDHGLNAYLSTRVRHGTLSNTLRKPLTDENLITSMNEEETGYLPNTYWSLRIYSGDEQDRLVVQKALHKFTISVDTIINRLKNSTLQIRVHHDLTDPIPKDEALFVYSSSNIERKFIQEYDRKIVNVEQFIDRCVESLWEKTDVNLSNVRRVLSETVRGEFISCFDDLVASLGEVSQSADVGELINAIARARTNFHAKFKLVSSWFRRSEVYDRQDYLPEYGVQIALNMVEKTMPKESNTLKVNIKNLCSDMTMPGRTLDAMVDVFADLFDNALIRSGVPPEQLQIAVKLELVDSIFTAEVSNNIAADKPSAADLEKLAKVKESLNKSDSRSRAQREGGSGFHKIWRSITSPIYKDPLLKFEFFDDGFRVNFKYRLEATENENIADRG
ncbi:hypothetical protein [Massilia antarctica]|uniref:hypothetical protein n=1 Tax=Massilia antarctica TaxID=2765360 RepID=UPI00226F56CE|nr:hypothetical protein [Massilia sp. H27-R4]MCY0912180.1 hypothetical protein [Massilia sp. H27-R4]